MKRAVIYIHGKGGNAREASRYKTVFCGYDVIGFDYISENPWDAQEEFSVYFSAMQKRYSSIVLIANSIGAFYALHALDGFAVEKAYFISPIVNMERLILDMMQWAGITETDLREKGTVLTDFGETLSWEYLTWVRKHPVRWNVPTAVLYASKDHLQSRETIAAFARQWGCALTVMENGEHWFHTQEQLAFLDNWLRSTLPHT